MIITHGIHKIISQSVFELCGEDIERNAETLLAISGLIREGSGQTDDLDDLIMSVAEGLCDLGLRVPNYLHATTTHDLLIDDDGAQDLDTDATGIDYKSLEMAVTGQDVHAYA